MEAEGQFTVLDALTYSWEDPSFWLGFGIKCYMRLLNNSFN